MADITTKQAALHAAGTKTTGASHGKLCVNVFTSPNTVTWAENDRMISPYPIPVGSRLTVGSYLSHAAMGTSVTADVGLVDEDGVEIDLDGIASSTNVASAGRTIVAGGALVGAGVEYVTTQVCYPCVTLKSATPTANAQIRAEIHYLAP